MVQQVYDREQEPHRLPNQVPSLLLHSPLSCLANLLGCCREQCLSAKLMGTWLAGGGRGQGCSTAHPIL